MLAEQFTDASVGGLSYVIGDEDRVLGRDIVNAHVVDPSGAYMTDANGTLLLEVCFDPKLAGHTFTLGAYALDNNRTGISTIETFRWSTYSSAIGTINNDGSQHTVYITLGISGEVSEHLIDVDIAPSAFVVETKPHCTIDTASSDYHTSDTGKVKIVLNTDGNVSATGGVDECTVQWDASPGSVLFEY